MGNKEFDQTKSRGFLLPRLSKILADTGINRPRMEPEVGPSEKEDTEEPDSSLACLLKYLASHRGVSWCSLG